MSFAFNPNQEPGSRIVAGSVLVQGEPLDVGRTYRLCTKGYLARGKDGYDCLASCRVVVNDEDGPQLSSIVQNHFKSVQIVSGAYRPKFHHRQSIIAVSRRKSIARQVSVIEESSSDQVDAAFSQVTAQFARRRWQKARFALAFVRRRTIQDVEASEVQYATAPRVESRIKLVGE